MNRQLLAVILLMGAALLFGSEFAWAAEKGGASADKMTYFLVAAFSCMFGLGIAAIGGATAQGRGIVSALDGMARNPGAAGDIRTSLIIGLALIGISRDLCPPGRHHLVVRRSVRSIGQVNRWRDGETSAESPVPISMTGPLDEGH